MVCTLLFSLGEFGKSFQFTKFSYFFCFLLHRPTEIHSAFKSILFQSCGICSSGLTPPTTTTPRPTTTTRRPRPTTTRRPSRPRPSCRDKNYKCKTWARYGYCRSSKYYYYMKKNCKQSCNYCSRSP